jgi:glycosyltransferase involved in cell wall biosynthesis
VKLLYLLSNFDYTSAGRQVSLLARALRSLPACLDVHVAALGADGPLAEPLRAAGVPVHVLGGGRFAASAWWRLRQLLGELRPDTVHAWRLPAARAAGALATLGRPPFRLIVSEPLRGGRPNVFDRRLGITAENICDLPPAVAPVSGDPPPFGLTLPPDAFVIMCVGRLTPEHGFRDAIWAADVLQHSVPTLQLVIVGDGPDRIRLERFARGINSAGRYLRFVPGRPDAAALLAHAHVVWIPGRGASGRQVMLEAMAAGRPVVAAVRPELAGTLIDGETGLVASPGTPPEVARQTRRLVDDPALGGRLGASARAAITPFSLDRVAAAYLDLYRSRKAASGSVTSADRHTD